MLLIHGGGVDPRISRRVETAVKAHLEVLPVVHAELESQEGLKHVLRRHLRARYVGAFPKSQGGLKRAMSDQYGRRIWTPSPESQ